MTTLGLLTGLRRRPVATLVALSALLLLQAEPASAQTTSTERIPASNGEGADLHLFRPAVDSRGFFSVNGAGVLPGNAISFGLVLDYGRNLLELASGHGSDYLVDHALQGTLSFNYGIADRLVLGLTAPVVLNYGTGVTDIGPGAAGNYDDDGLTAEALGHIALHAKLRLLSPDGPIGLALLVQGGYGIGGQRNFGADPGFFYWPQLIVEKQFGKTNVVRLGLNAGYRGHTGTNPTFGLDQAGLAQLKSGVFQYGNLGTGGFAASVRIGDKFDITAETYASYLLGGDSDAKQRLSAEVLGGFKVFIQKNSYLSLAGGVGYLPGFQSASQRGMLAFVFEPFEEDRDKDGIPDDVDQCPSDPEDKDGDEDTDGCPEDDPVDEPVQVRSGDRDGDGILDAEDGCPDNAEDKDGFEDTDGCPEEDNDKDGIPDVRDKCINTPEDKDNFKDDDGCPEDDNDADGKADAEDKCPDEPETYNGKDDEDGCPDKGSVIVQDNNVLILEKILFKTGSAEILAQSLPIVDAVAATLKGNPSLKLLEVQGHADVRGAEFANVKLTQARAESVVKALIERGVDASRLRAMGYGPFCPVDPANNAVAWDKNRRVEFKIVRTDAGPTGVELGCEKARSKGISSPSP
ncbi:OmpA family protein [Polyangium jinanense]|uniref:OmpA family protein n=1 Tax=Polyangium jinanense TaxID=2829994 RepID=A0A9X3WY96_9BACT|nr:OmpA family protein [Polyangium jinanense]MDC3952850.1 OmpA family protein [Polyangium jinanense]MDC3980469.1 OmpA family protein [Polyangium jinanense]